MHSMTRWILVATALSIVASDGLDAQGKPQGKGKPGAAPEPVVSLSVVFRPGDQNTFRTWFETHKITAQPLPPGIAKNVARGKPLPPGIANRAVPAELIALGPKLERDVSLAIVGAVVVALRQGVVIDVLAGIFP